MIPTFHRLTILNVLYSSPLSLVLTVSWGWRSSICCVIFSLYVLIFLKSAMTGASIFRVFSHSVRSNSLWPMDCSPPGSSVLRIFQARILEWVAICFSRGSSRPRDWTQVSYIAGGFFTIWATREAQWVWRRVSSWAACASLTAGLSWMGRHFLL